MSGGHKLRAQNLPDLYQKGPARLCKTSTSRGVKSHCDRQPGSCRYQFKKSDNLLECSRK